MVNTHLLRVGARFWILETAISFINYFLLMSLVYEPAWGVLPAHQVGMSTRIGCICVLAWCMLRKNKGYCPRELVRVGLLWVGLELLFEWGGSLLVSRPVEEILVGWNVLAGYMWPYVLATYLLSPLVVGSIIPRIGQGQARVP